MPPRRIPGTAGFDIAAKEEDGAFELWKLVNTKHEKFQEARSLLIQVSVEGFDDFQDDQWAMALESMRPGNKPHNLKFIKIIIVGQEWFEACSKTVTSPAASRDAPKYQQDLLMTSQPTHSQFSKFLVWFKAERAFIKALSNVRGVEKIEIVGPMPADLKKQLGVAMTTRPGHRVRDWRYGGGLRTDEEIGWGSWSASMQAADEETGKQAADYRSPAFYDQTFLPQQPIELEVNKHFKPISYKPPVETDSASEADASDSIPKKSPGVATDENFIPSKDGNDSDSSSASTTVVRTLGEANRGKKHYTLKFPPSPPGEIARVNKRKQDSDDFGGPHAEPERFARWFAGTPQKGECEWILPTGKGARVQVARRIPQEMAEADARAVSNEGVEDEDSGADDEKRKGEHEQKHDQDYSADTETTDQDTTEGNEDDCDDEDDGVPSDDSSDEDYKD